MASSTITVTSGFGYVPGYGIVGEAGTPVASPKAENGVADITRPRGGMVKLAPDNGASPLTLILAGTPDRGGGVGGWASTDRALRQPARWWQNQPEDTLSLPCMLDIKGIGGPAIERRLAVLYAMGQPDESGEPPTVRAIGDVPDDASKKWVVQNITLGDRLYQSDGTLRRQLVTVELEGWRPLPSIKPVAIKSTRSAGKRRTRTITTRKGDTLRAISVRQLGQSDAWKSLRNWNPKALKGVDPDTPLKAGLKLKVR